jgi:hypothetical protein
LSGKKSIPIEKAVHITCVNLSDVVAERNPVGAVLVSERDDILELIGEGRDGIDREGRDETMDFTQLPCTVSVEL